MDGLKQLNETLPGLTRPSNEGSMLSLRITSAGSPEAWLKSEHPRLLPLLAGAPVAALAAQGEHMLADAAARLDACAHCPTLGGACDRPPPTAFAPGQEPTWDGSMLDSRMCSKWRDYVAARSLMGSGVPRAISHASFENFKTKNSRLAVAFDAAVKYVETFDPHSGKGLMFVGTSGVGKSHLCAAILRALRERHPRLTALFADVPLMIDTVQSAIGKPPSDDRFDIRYKARVSRLLVLDDLSAERHTDYTRGLLAQIMRFRADGLRPMLITTNAKRKALESYFGEATMSRVFQACGDPIPLVGDNGRDHV